MRYMVLGDSEKNTQVPGGIREVFSHIRMFSVTTGPGESQIQTAKIEGITLCHGKDFMPYTLCY